MDNIEIRQRRDGTLGAWFNGVRLPGVLQPGEAGFNYFKITLGLGDFVLGPPEGSGDAGAVWEREDANGRSAQAN